MESEFGSLPFILNRPNWDFIIQGAAEQTKESGRGTTLAAVGVGG